MLVNTPASMDYVRSCGSVTLVLRPLTLLGLPFSVDSYLLSFQDLNTRTEASLYMCTYWAMHVCTYWAYYSFLVHESLTEIKLALAYGI